MYMIRYTIYILYIVQFSSERHENHYRWSALAFALMDRQSFHDLVSAHPFPGQWKWDQRDQHLEADPLSGFHPRLPCFAMSYGFSMMNVVIVDPSTLGYYHVLPLFFIDLTYLQDSRVNLVIWPSCPLLASWTCDCPGCIGIEPNLHPLKFAWEKAPKDPKVIKLPWFLWKHSKS